MTRAGRGEKSELSFGQTFAYLAPSIPISTLAAPALAVLPALYAKHGAVSMAMIGTILFATRLFDAFIDPAIGYLSDRTNTRLGKRKPWIIAGGLIAAIGGFFWLRPHGEAGAMWFLVSSVVVYLGWSLFEIPYSAWFSELTPDYDARSRLSTWRAAAAGVGYLIFVSAPLWPVFETTEMTPEVTALFSWLLLISIPVAVGFAVTNAPNQLGTPAAQTAINPVKAMKEVGRNGLFWMITVSQSLAATASGMVGALYFFYLDAYLGILDKIAYIGLAVGGLSLVTMPMWPPIIRYLGKHVTMAVCTLSTAVTLVGMAFLQPGPLAFPLLMVIFGLSTILNTGSAICPPAIMADIVDFDEYRTGNAKAANYFAFPALFMKVGMAAGGGVAFIIAGLFGFNPAGDNGSVAMTGFFTAFIFIPIVLNVVAAVIMFRFPLTRSRHAAIKRRLEVRHGQ